MSTAKKSVQRATAEQVRDLRGTLEWLKAQGDLIETDKPVDPDLERHHGPGGGERDDGLLAAVDDRGRQVEEEVGDPGAASRRAWAVRGVGGASPASRQSNCLSISQGPGRYG